MVLPAWFASTLHVPTPVKETTPAEIEHTEEVEASMVKVTVSPEVVVAVGV